MIWFSYASPVIMVVAVWVAYRVGKRSRDKLEQQQELGDLGHAKFVVQDLEQISQQVRRSLVSHHASIVQFKERISKLTEGGDAEALKELSREAEQILQPTIQLASQIAHAYDEIRQQTDQLSAPDQLRTDPLTGLSSRRAMEDILKMLLAMRSRYDTSFSIALVDIDGFQKINDQHGHVHGDEMLRSFAATIDSAVRETDVVVRFGGEEFVVIMPETDLSGAGVFGQRLRKNVYEKLELAISVGTAEARDGDTLKSLLSRTDSALYSAKAGGGDAVFQHTGRHIEMVRAVKSVALAVPDVSTSTDTTTTATNA
ncbi:MAG: GGDEF domain-containing protein [Planctomycetaceae bacterium]|nr:GGDEF domain-containing protein [Planctomycetales bacterium]MCB9874360.1 GGDEF domain-containing protein [Planctomycetaceae bacterium]MCB9940500.1 GGDEF domain-containing protein [Planctomycetaceae bacterium]